MQPHRTDVDWTLDEVDSLLDTDLFLVLDHDFASREPFWSHVSAEQSNAIGELFIGNGILTLLPSQGPSLVGIASAQSVLEVTLGFSLAQSFFDPLFYRLDCPFA